MSTTTIETAETVQEMADILRELVGYGAMLARVLVEKALRQAAVEEAEPAQVTPPPSRTPTPAILFMRLCTNIRQAVALHIRLTTGPLTKADRQSPDQKAATAEAAELKAMQEQIAKLGQEIAKNAKLAA